MSGSEEGGRQYLGRPERKVDDLKRRKKMRRMKTKGPIGVFIGRDDEDALYALRSLTSIIQRFTNRCYL